MEFPFDGNGNVMTADALVCSCASDTGKKGTCLAAMRAAIVADMPNILIHIANQTLELRDDEGNVLRSYAVSTAANGAGEQCGSNCTPRGRHVIRAKIGAGAPAGSVFVARRPTGEIHTPELASACPGRDWILTRILWLSGCEPGVNRLGEVDTMRRYIYIHGCPDTEPMSIPRSHGCVRMRNADIIALFDLVTPGTSVDICG